MFVASHKLKGTENDSPKKIAHAFNDEQAILGHMVFMTNPLFFSKFMTSLFDKAQRELSTAGYKSESLTTELT